MPGFRQKLAFAFAGLLGLLVVVGLTSIFLLGKYSATIETIFRENYDTVLYAREMQEASDVLDALAEQSAWTGTAPDEDRRKEAVARFEANLAAEAGNVTLPGEAEAVALLRHQWNDLVELLATLFASGADAGERREFYRSRVLPTVQAIQQTAQHVIDANIANMLSVDGEVRAQAGVARHAMIALMLAGALLALGFTLVVARSILKPLRTLTASVREIEQGNLEARALVTSNDEIGELGEAFNAMASRLREFRRSDEAKLLRTQRTTQLALDTFPDAVAVVGPDATIELANHAARRVFGLEPGRSIDDAPHAILGEIFYQTVETRQPFHPQGYASSIRVYDAGERHVQPQAVPILDAERKLIGVTIVLTDVTSLRRLDETKSGLISVVSHELKTPLTSIRMATHLLLENRAGPLTDRQRELLAAACEDSDRLYSIIDSLLDIGRIESGSGMLDLAEVPVERIVESARRSATAQLEAANVRLAVDLEPRLPAVLADVDRLAHVLTNLLENARRFSRPGGTVTIRARRDGAFVRFTVEDDGAGIAPSDLPRVFDRFYRGAEQPAGSGAGLGLAIVKEIVEAHGGRVSVESVPARGSAFHFTLRAACAGAVAADPTAAATGSRVASRP